MDIFGGLSRLAGNALGITNFKGAQDLQSSPEIPLPDFTPRPQIAPNVERLHDAFITTDMRDRSEGAISPMSRESASALTGNYIVETGDRTLSNTDVVEKRRDGTDGPGRGLAQYTSARRGPYDKARERFLTQGGDPNSMEFQLDYAADEYAGKYDPSPGQSLSGWMGTLSGETDSMTIPEAATHFRKDFFRPSVPHNEKRITAAQLVDQEIQARNQRIAELSDFANLKNSSLSHVGHRGVDGRYWAGDDYGWQSPESYKKLIKY